MRILLVDDHPLVADALALALSTLDRQAQIRHASSLQSALEIAAGPPEFDLVMLDLGLPGCMALQALERFRERHPALPVVVFSGTSDTASITAALDLGAMGFIPKTSAREVLVNAVRLVLSGGVYVPPEALKSAGANTQAPAAPSTLKQLQLSPRQGEVLALLLKGLPNKLIAKRLQISENTTKIHVSAVLHALGVTSRTQALIAANRLGLRLEAP
ncbi:MAG TPA: response regulator transcription factor [Burkholderiales bacterium]|nr:response regulator transcription factor [Burkholderiales bacterium]